MLRQIRGFPPLPPGAPPPLPPDDPPPLPPEPPPLPQSRTLPESTGRQQHSAVRKPQADDAARRSYDAAHHPPSSGAARNTMPCAFHYAGSSAEEPFKDALESSPLQRRCTDASVLSLHQRATHALHSLEWVLGEHLDALRDGQIEFEADEHERARAVAALCEQLSYHIRALLPAGDGCMLPNGIASQLNDLLGGSDDARSYYDR